MLGTLGTDCRFNEPGGAGAINNDMEPGGFDTIDRADVMGIDIEPALRELLGESLGWGRGLVACSTGPDFSEGDFNKAPWFS